jgi:hypothetical protein
VVNKSAGQISSEKSSDRPLLDVTKLSAADIASLRSLLGIQQVDLNPVVDNDDDVYFAEKDSSVRPNITVQVDANNVSDNEYAPFDQDNSGNYEHAGVQSIQTHSRDFLSKGFSQALF